MVDFIDAVTEPAFSVAAANVSVEPANVALLYASIDPATYTTAVTLSEPGVAANWIAASMDPTLYTALLAKMTDPATMMRWAAAPST